MSQNREFLFATGIENSYPTIRLPDGSERRIDEMEKCGHYDRWREDFQLVLEIGCPYLRYGPPYHRTHLGPGRYDWGFADETFGELERLGITPIVDLCHFGVPDWLGNFQNPEWPRFYAEYCEAFARRFPSLRLYTPINEIMITALFSAQYGWWNERLTGHRSFVTALKHLCQANILSMQALLKIAPNPIFIQNESSEYFHAMEPSCLPLAEFLNRKRFLALDLSYGFPITVPIYEYLLENGMTRAEYRWFQENTVKARCVMGTDYYATNEHMVYPDGHWEPAGEIFGYYVITRQYHARYRLPVMHTETNLYDSDAAPQWLRKEWANMLRLRQDGVPIIGFTWYSLTDQKDWETALRNDDHNVNPCGLYDLDRKIRPVGLEYRKLISQWRDILPTESIGLHFDS